MANRTGKRECLLVSAPVSAREGGAWPTRLESLALGYLTSFARKQGYTIEAIDAGCLHLKSTDLMRQLAGLRIRVLGISVLSHPDLPTAMTLAHSVRRTARISTLVMGGVPATLSYKEILAHCPEVDIVVLGEGEQTLVDILRCKRAAGLIRIPGIAFRCNNTVVRNSKAPGVGKLDELPFPDREAVVSRAPSEIWRRHFQIHTSRGCPFNCSFCCVRAFANCNEAAPYRTRSVESILDEIEFLVRERGARVISFNDSNFIVGAKGRRRALGLAAGLMKRGLKVPFSLLMRADEVTKNLLDPLKRAGLYSVTLGIESGVQGILDELGKKTTIAQNSHAIQTVQALGLRCVPGFIMYTPDCTLEEIGKNVAFLRQHGLLAGERFQILVPYPGTPVARRLAEQGRLIPGDARLGFVGRYEFADRRVDVFRQAVDYGRCTIRELEGRLDEIKATVATVFTRTGRNLSDRAAPVAQTGVAEVRTSLYEMLETLVAAAFQVSRARPPMAEPTWRVFVDEEVQPRANLCAAELDALRAFVESDLECA
jgi:radical SAM superfamily enzyme YgiQ (UPF0313 family)